MPSFFLEPSRPNPGGLSELRCGPNDKEIQMDMPTAQSAPVVHDRMTPSEQPKSPLSKPLFVILLCTGYICAALSFYFMFNNIGAHPA
jgi:hypothetical protein